MFCAKACSVPDPDLCQPCHQAALTLPSNPFRVLLPHSKTRRVYSLVILLDENSSTASPQFHARLVRHLPACLDIADKFEGNCGQPKPSLSRNGASRKLTSRSAIKVERTPLQLTNYKCISSLQRMIDPDYLVHVHRVRSVRIPHTHDKRSPLPLLIQMI